MPIYFILGVLPFLMRLMIVDTNLTAYPWYPNTSKIGDVFLYVKSIAFIVMAIGMVIVLLDRRLLQRKKGELSIVYLALAGYGLLAVISTLLSHNKYFSFYGMPEQFESIWVLLGYGVAVTYCNTVVNDSKQVARIQKVVYVSAFIMAIIGVLQYLKLDFFETKIGTYLFIPNALKGYRDSVIFNFSLTDLNRVYMTLYNPNYVGVYLCMIIPFSMIGLLTCKTVKGIVVFFILNILLIWNLIGCGSKSAIMVLPVLVIVGIIFFRKKIIKHKKCVFIGVVCLLILSGITFLTVGQSYYSRLMDSITVSRQEYNLTEVKPEKNAVKIIYKKEAIYISSEYNTNQTITLHIKDENQTDLLLEEQPNSDGYYSLKNKKYSELSFLSYEKEGIKYVAFQCNSLKWRFSDVNGNGYQYITINGKPDDIINAPSILNGYEQLFTFRGYIWGRTIPLLSKYLLFGAGPDQFALVFPQNDYVMRSNMSYGFFTETLTKPHSLYLQIAVQTGVLSLLCFLGFVGTYLWKSFVLLKSKKELKKLDYTAIALFLSILGYLLCGLTNDSCIAIAPIFWVLLGVGMSINRMIQKENKK